MTNVSYNFSAPKSDGLWPKLFYSGYIFNTNFYTIVTEFIEGRPPDSTSQVDFDKCLESLNKLHEVGILHGDPRPPNFIIETSSQKAYILDFGFSSILGKLNESEKKKDIKIMKRSFNIDIN
jgi:tRNA A-37 threonylcarbamoyl transferase component Bud32